MLNSSNNSSWKIQTLTDINFSLNKTQVDRKEHFRKILEALLVCAKGEAASILLRNIEDDCLHFETSVGIGVVELTDFVIKPGEGIAGWVVQNERSLIVNEAKDDKRFFPKVSKLSGHETHTILAVPVRVRSECIGVIEVINKGTAFTDDDRQWAEVFANLAGLAIISSSTSGFPAYSTQKEQVSVQTMVHHSAIMQRLVDRLDKIAQSDASVFINGESGVGKELVAERIHSSSQRSSGPLVKIHCPSLPEMLLESELFGHVKGAFTDAVKNRKGKLEIARGGTVFLDEIADITPAVQAKLLRVLESRKYEPLGSNQIKTADVRIISASNKSLGEEVRRGRFREDLFYRLNIVPIFVPPLRDRRDDIPFLAKYFLKKVTTTLNKNIKRFSSGALEQLITYSWPGNVRELYNAVERAVVLCTGENILSEHLLIDGDDFQKELYSGKSLKDSLNLFKKNFIYSTLSENNWNQTKTAKTLEIQRTYLSRLIKELNIERSST